jgi:hypothetical protein
MKTFIKFNRTLDNQKTANFTGEGAYHGSSNKAPEQTPVLGEKKAFSNYNALFKNCCEVKKTLAIPTQEAIQADGVTFVWALFDEAIKEAGPLSKVILQEMEPYLKRDKRFIYVDSKIQYFGKGDLPVDSKIWHVDGTVAIRGEAANNWGYTLLHDLRAKEKAGIEDHYLAYQSSEHCATEWVKDPLTLSLPEYIPTFDLMDELVIAANPKSMSQPSASIVHFTDNSLHRAVPASGEGWRLWIRVLETDKEIKLSTNVVECYGTVFKNIET